MTIDMNKTYRTRDGHEVRIYSLDGSHPFSVHGAVKIRDYWAMHSWTNKGKHTNTPYNSPLNLIEVVPESEVWINEYANRVVSRSYNSKEEADRFGRHRLNLHRVVLGPDTIVDD